MKFRTALTSRPLLDSTLRRTRKPHRAVQSCGAETLLLKRKNPQKRLQSVSKSLRLFVSIRVFVWCGMFHNAEMDLRGTENRCANRLCSCGLPVMVNQNLSAIPTLLLGETLLEKGLPPSPLTKTSVFFGEG